MSRVLPPGCLSPRGSGACALALAVVLATSGLRAGPVEDKATARELALAGIEAEKAGDCKGAITKLEKAEALFHAPPHLQHLARCYEKVGRLVDAAETWRKLSAEVVPEGAPEQFKEAVTEATTELPKVEARLGRLQITAKQSYPELVVEVDGLPWPSAAMDVPRVIDPGTHVVRVTAKDHAPAQTPVTVPEGGTVKFDVQLEKAKKDLPIKPPPPVPPPVASPLHTVGWVGVVAGGTLLVGGVVTGLMAKSKYDGLKSDCPNDRCPFGTSTLDDRKSSIRTLSMTTTILLVAGPTLAVGGLTLVLLSPAKSSTSASVQANPTGFHVSLTGTF